MSTVPTSPDATTPAALGEATGSEDPHVLVDRRGRVVWANAAALELIDPGCEGRLWSDVIGMPAEPVAALLSDARRSTSQVPLTMRVTGRTGQLGGVSGARLSALDARVLLRVRSERGGFGELTATLDRLNAEIARRQDVEEELSRVLNTTVLSLQRSNAALSEFAETAAHDLRSPLARISGFAELVADSADLDPASAAMLGRIEQAALDAAELVETLLTEARTRARDNHQDVCLVDLLAWVRSMVDERAVVVRHEDDLPTVRVAEQPVRQLLLNLVQNSAKHRTGPDPAHVLVSVVEASDVCTVSVADDGPGIPEDARATVFERGFSTSAGGTSGLGLHLCRRIVQQHGGTIEVTDSPLGGCAFTFTLPVANAA
ncbi:HAMP domain-containing histidine kinase [Nocardioidaceae bacterium]|nr:HAMP domain-containing histidine kinase [Nocardioidaceae bacterium]